MLLNFQQSISVAKRYGNSHCQTQKFFQSVHIYIHTYIYIYTRVYIYIYTGILSINNHNPINTHHSPINIRSKSSSFSPFGSLFFTVPGVAGTGPSPSSPPSPPPPPPRRRRVLRVVGVVLAEGCHGCQLHRALMTWKHGKTRSKHKEVHGIHRSVLSKMIDLMGKLIMINNHWWQKRQESPHPNQIIDHIDTGDSILSS